METFRPIHVRIGHLVADGHSDPLMHRISSHMPVLGKTRLKLEQLMTGLSWMSGHDQGGDVSAQLETQNGKLGVPLVLSPSQEIQFNAGQPSVTIKWKLMLFSFPSTSNTLYFMLIFNVTAA